MQWLQRMPGWESQLISSCHFKNKEKEFCPILVVILTIISSNTQKSSEISVQEKKTPPYIPHAKHLRGQTFHTTFHKVKQVQPYSTCLYFKHRWKHVLWKLGVNLFQLLAPLASPTRLTHTPSGTDPVPSVSPSPRKRGAPTQLLSPRRPREATTQTAAAVSGPQLPTRPLSDVFI